jgi:hypothetical protein
MEFLTYSLCVKAGTRDKREAWKAENGFNPGYPEGLHAF